MKLWYDETVVRYPTILMNREPYHVNWNENTVTCGSGRLEHMDFKSETNMGACPEPKPRKIITAYQKTTFPLLETQSGWKFQRCRNILIAFGGESKWQATSNPARMFRMRLEWAGMHLECISIAAGIYFDIKRIQLECNSNVVGIFRLPLECGQ